MWIKENKWNLIGTAVFSITLWSLMFQENYYIRIGGFMIVCYIIGSWAGGNDQIERLRK